MFWHCLTFTFSNFKKEIRVSRSNIEFVLKHIPVVDNKNILLDIEQVFKNSRFKETASLDTTKDKKNIGKKIARGVVEYNYYESTWNNSPVLLNMEVMKNGYEQPYAILFEKEKR